MPLKEDILSSCTVCGGIGRIDDFTFCECFLKFRVYNRLVGFGFSKGTLDLVSSDSYKIPVIEKGEKSIKSYLDNVDLVENNGLSLYIHSRERGRGKTTLAHYIIYGCAKVFSDISLYKSCRNYCFIHVEDFINKIREGEEDFWKSTWFVLDDLGNEDKSAEWKRTFLRSSLQRVLHYRRDNSLPTIITSNYDPSSLSYLYSGELDSLLEIKPDNSIGGLVFREIEVGGGEDFRTIDCLTKWADLEKENEE
jgi:hypothetical protein